MDKGSISRLKFFSPFILAAFFGVTFEGTYKLYKSGKLDKENLTEFFEKYNPKGLVNKSREYFSSKNLEEKTGTDYFY
jgi:hypothetical protein